MRFNERPASCVRLMFTTKLAAFEDITREIEINLSGPIRMVKQFLPGPTERVVVSILRAVVDLGLACGATPRSTEKRAMRAVCGYLCYTG